MNRQISWMAKNHVASNLLMFLFVVGGLVLGSSIKQEVFPEISLDQVVVSVPYPGASPEEVEEGIILKVEENISGVDGIKEIKSVAGEGVGTVTAVVQTGEDPDRVLQDIKSEVDRISTFPDEAEKPIISKALIRHEVISVVIYGEVPERTLRERAEALRDELLAREEITQAELVGVRPYEISIEVPEANLRRYQVTLEQLAQKVREASVDLPGGAIKTRGGEILVRTKERRYHGQGYEDLVVLANPDGTAVRLADLATVRDTFEETDVFGRFDNMPAAMITVYRVGDQKPTVISDVVHRFTLEKAKALPESLHISTWNDNTELLRSRFHLLLKNAFMGLILVFLVLGLFMEIRLALWVMLGIPISFLGALFLMPMTGVSINMITLFAFIMALGIVVDDAIVVGENVYAHRQQGMNYTEAAIAGAKEVGLPVVFSVLTTICAFIPLLHVIGTMGKFIKVIPVVVICILAVSLIESLFILPAHLCIGERRVATGRFSRLSEQIRNRAAGMLDRFINGPYQRTLNLCLQYRYVTLAGAIALLLLCAGFIGGGIIKFRFMPDVDGDIVLVDLKMPQGTLAADTSRVEQYLMKKCQATIAEFDHKRPGKPTILRHVFSVVGATVPEGGPAGGSSMTGTHRANIVLFLQASEERNLPAADVARRWRELAGEIPGVDSLTFTSNLVRFGANIDVRLAHDDFGILVKAVNHLKGALGQYTGVSDITDTYPLGKQELKFHLAPEARTLGVSEAEMGRQLRAAFYGAEALRIQRGRNEVKVMVRYPEEERKSLWNVETMRIRTPDGGELPIQRAATIEAGRGYSEINRAERKRVINIRASVDSKLANAEETVQNLQDTVLTALIADYPALTYDLEGEDKERRESMGSMRQGFLLALFGIFALLAIPLRSYSQPLIIMAAIPFGMVGAVLGHGILGYNLSILSLFGLVALSGVAVNDSLLLIDQINRSRASGLPVWQAVQESGKRRFRPILLTSLTTFFGLTPMIFERSVQAQFLIPMAISLGYGILFATGITLLLIPCLYLILEDIRHKMAAHTVPIESLPPATEP